MPTVSVVIPVHNGGQFLNQALDSVFAQTFRDYEVICVDDGSTDASIAVIGEYSKRVTLVRQANAGPSAARNAGVERATGRYVAFLDADDLWYPEKLRRQLAVIEWDHNVVLAHCNYDRSDIEGKIVKYGAALKERASSLSSPLGRLIGEGHVPPSAMLVRREVFESVGMFDSELLYFEDFDLCARLKREGSFAFLEEPGMCIRLHTGSHTRSYGNSIKILRSQERFLLRMRELYGSDPEKQAIIKILLADCYSNFGMNQVMVGHRGEGRLMFCRSLRYNPFKFRTYSRLLRAFLPHVGRRN